ncbi:MAG: methyltransferase domain-containing protein [Candidatus Tectomicrobia bacterium]
MMPRFQVEQHLVKLLQHLGLEQAHFGARLDIDWTGLVVTYPDVVASLTLICPTGISPVALAPLASHLLVINDDQRSGQRVSQAMQRLPDAKLVTLDDYSGLLWTDIVADRPETIGAAMLDFLAQMEPLRAGAKTVTRPAGQGEIDGLIYTIEGTGPPLVLLPFSLSPSQWGPILPTLQEHYTTITLSGAEVGFTAVLEARGRSGYLRVIRSVWEEISLNPGERILEVGCGTGVLSRWLAHHTERQHPIVAMDVNEYLLQEATALAAKEGLDRMIEYRAGNAENLPFPDASFHATLSFTVLEEGNADRILAEMMRVTKPGGQVAVVVRGLDLPWVVNLPIRSELKARAEAPWGLHIVAQGGCADTSLYRRFHQVGLKDTKLFPHLAALDGPMGYYYLDRIEAALNDEDAQEWRAALSQAERDGTLFIAQPFHCAVGTKPSSSI